MPERAPAPTAEERLLRLHKDRERLRRERMLREVAGPRWQRLVRIIPVLFLREGEIEVRRIEGARPEVIDALKADAVFALDAAMRIRRGHGFLRGGDVHVYLAGREPIDRLVESGLISNETHLGRILLRPWPGPPRLFACVVERWPPHLTLETGFRVVDDERLKQELVGAVGQRPDLFALAEP